MTFLPDQAVDRLRQSASLPALPPGRYTLGAPIGRGGMGTVYAARDELLGRDVAIKVSNAPAPDSSLEARLRQEARVLAHLEHPGIVAVHDAGLLDDGRLFYVMKLVRGETLSDHANRLDSEAAVLPLFERVVDTVAFAHEAFVIHRDLKPSNVMVGRFGEVLVVDWGVAKVTGAEGVRSAEGAEGAGCEGADGDNGTKGAGAATADGTRLGTPGFMAPEQAAGHASRVGPPADVFSLGALLFWMLAKETAPASADGARARLRALSPRPPARLRGIIGKCLAPDPAGRYPDAAALADDLARYRAGRPVTAHRETILERAGRWLVAYQAAILLVLAYLVMRTIFALSQR